MIKKMNFSLSIFTLLVLVLYQSLVYSQSSEECTIGVASGKVTSDGRPLIWKTRDNSSEPDNEVVFNTSFDLKFLEVANAGETYAWMGVNENGFAILNSLATDLIAGDNGLSNGSLMREALGNFSSILEFESFLDETNNSGRKTRGNFAVLDNTGEAVLYEIDGANYWKYSTSDSLLNPEGYIVRTNFALNGDGSGGGYERFYRSSNLIKSFADGDSLNYKSILRNQMRDFSDFDSEEVSVPFEDQWISSRPFGYIYTDVSICRSSSVSATVIQGIKSGESEKLSTMWTILGNPAASIAVPYWPVGPTPVLANGNSTAPLCDISLEIKSELFDYLENLNYIDSYKLLDGEGGGIWPKIFAAEDTVFNITEQLLEGWREETINTDEILNAESDLAASVHQKLQEVYSDLITDIENYSIEDYPNEFTLSQNYPNPFNPSTKINFSIVNSGHVTIKIYDLLGKEVITLIDQKMESGPHSVILNTTATNLSSGIYVYRIFFKGEQFLTESKRMILLK
jgi:hypothetical protein